MKYQISFSGGKGSAISALIAHEKGLDFNLIFADTGIEDEDLHRFNGDVARAVGREIIKLRDGRTPWDVFIDRKYIGNTRTAHCSTELKTKPVFAWLAENSEADDPLVLGMDWEEIDRIERAREFWAPRPVVSLLIKHKVYRQQYSEILERYGIAPPRLYLQGFSHNNCGGFCVKAGQGQFARLLASNPERYKFHELEMQRAMQDIGPTARPFLRRKNDGETEYLTLKEFRELREKGGQVDAYSPEGCGCFIGSV
jgi:hypothetical protein